MKFLPLVWSNLKRKKVRALLTLLSIAVAFLLFGYLAAIRQAFTYGIDVAGVDRLVVRHRVSLIRLLPESYEGRIEGIPGVVDAVHATWFGGVYQDPKNFFGQFPVEPAEYLGMFPEFLLPEKEKAAWLATRTGAIVGRNIADRFDWTIGDRIPIQATVWRQEGGSSTWEFDLVGIYDGADPGTDTTQFLFHYDYFDEARFIDRHDAALDLLQPFRVDIHTQDIAAEIGETRPAHEAYVTGTYHAYLQHHPLPA